MSFDEAILKAKTLVEALPYIKRFNGRTLVVKFGASLLADDGLLKHAFVRDVLLLKYVGIRIVIVHGGGDEITRWAKRLGKSPEFIDGLRVTDEETAEIAEMVLSGKVNSELVALFNQSGGRAVGLSGKDANLIIAQRTRTKDNQDVGFVGDIEAVDPAILTTLIDKGYTPILSSTGLSREGESLSIKSDHVAGAVASALKAAKLIYLTNVAGILKGGALIDFLDLNDAESLRGDPEVTGGMLSKLEDSIKALKGGVTQVHIIDGKLEHAVLLEVFTDKGIGTMISNEHARI